jgi:NADH-quinone oxidoreductase subunit N
VLDADDRIIFLSRNSTHRRFFGKLFLLSAGALRGNYIFIAIAALNMIISLYYYLRVVRAMFMDKNENPLPRVVHSGVFYLCIGDLRDSHYPVRISNWLYDYILALA